MNAALLPKTAPAHASNVPAPGFPGGTISHGSRRGTRPAGRKAKGREERYLIVKVPGAGTGPPGMRRDAAFQVTGAVAAKHDVMPLYNKIKAA